MDRCLALVQRALAQADPKTTFLYVHMRAGTPRLYQVDPVAARDDISTCIAEEWKKASQTAKKVWFKKPWVPSGILIDPKTLCKKFQM